MNIIRFNTPASDWHESCLLGNGFMGEAVYGQPIEEKVDLSESAFFSGSDKDNPYQVNANKAFSNARKAAVNKTYDLVNDYVDDYIGKRCNYGTNLPVGKLIISFNDKSREISNYSRKLDIMHGISEIEFDDEKGHENRYAFSSHPDRVFVYCIERDKTDISADISVSSGSNPGSYRINNDTILFDISAREDKHSDGSCGAELSGGVKICIEEGTITAKEDCIKVRDCRKLVIFLSMYTDYSVLLGKKELIPDINAILKNYGIENLNAVKQRHADDVFSIMSRQHIMINDADDSNLTTKELIKLAGNGDNAYLTGLMYQYGRYLLLSSSREDSIIPAHLQGVWNDNVACRIGWTCDMHLDINTQMNYWISEGGNLSECHLPLFAWMKYRLIPQGRKTAKYCYGMSGWTAELVSNAWGYAAPYWNKALSPCPASGAWIASDYVEHFRYTQDKEFLKNEAMPAISEAAEFFADYVFEDENGKLSCGPSISPENIYLVDNRKYYASVNCTFEVLMIKELMKEYIELSDILDVKEPLYAKAQSIINKLPDYRIKADGTIAEWEHDFPSEDRQHRHTSHLLGLFPYKQINPDKTPELALAAQKTIDDKLTPYENWEDTGWARSLLMLYSARLKNKKEASRHLLSMQNTLTADNLLVMHPPTRGTATENPVYELDGNTGFSMSVLEMLIQNHDNVIELLPSLPDEWEKGCFKGICIPGNMTVNMKWDRHELTEISILCHEDRNISIIYQKNKKQCKKSCSIVSGIYNNIDLGKNN